MIPSSNRLDDGTSGWVLASVVAVLVAGFLAAAAWGADGDDADKPLLANLVLDKNMTMESLTSLATSKGMRACYEKLYPKGNAYAAQKFDLSATGDIAAMTCAGLAGAAQGETLRHTKQGQTPALLLDATKNDPAMATIVAERSVTPPKSLEQHGQVLATCKKSGMRAALKMLGAKAELLTSVTDSWGDGLLSPEEIQRACDSMLHDIEHSNP